MFESQDTRVFCDVLLVALVAYTFIEYILFRHSPGLTTQAFLTSLKVADKINK